MQRGQRLASMCSAIPIGGEHSLTSDADQASDLVPPSPLSLVVSEPSSRAVSTDVLPPDAVGQRGWLARLRRWFAPRPNGPAPAPANGRAPMPISELSVASLRTELRVVDRDIAGVLGQLSTLQLSERKALERRDKAALDAAWASREAQNARLRELETHRDAVYEAIAARFQPQVASWTERASSTAEGWRKDDRERLDTLRALAAQIEALVAEIAGSRLGRADQYRQLLEELDSLRQAADPVNIPTPDVDWSQPALDFAPLDRELEQARRALLQHGQNGPRLVGSDLDAEPEPH
jgi:hypothetical protein